MTEKVYETAFINMMLVCLSGKMQFSHHSSFLFQHMCNSCL